MSPRELRRLVGASTGRRGDTIPLCRSGTWGHVPARAPAVGGSFYRPEGGHDPHMPKRHMGSCPLASSNLDGVVSPRELKPGWTGTRADLARREAPARAPMSRCRI